MSKSTRRLLDPAREDFGTILNCAVRYALGRRTYMPGTVMDFITPLLPEIDNKTLYVLDQDITDARYTSGYGDPRIDEPEWMKFLAAVQAEEKRRGIELYKDWRRNLHEKS
jgi:hypothetical protein